MRNIGWAVAVILGSFAAFTLAKNMPDLVRYVKISTM